MVLRCIHAPMNPLPVRCCSPADWMVGRWCSGASGCGGDGGSMEMGIKAGADAVVWMGTFLRGCKGFVGRVRGRDGVGSRTHMQQHEARTGQTS